MKLSPSPKEIIGVVEHACLASVFQMSFELLLAKGQRNLIARQAWRISHFYLCGRSGGINVTRCASLR
jgi:hypothetical protein